MKAWLIAFAVTQAVEVPIYGFGATERKWTAAFGASLITQPVVWFLFPRYFPGSFPVMIGCAWLFCVAVEAAWLTSFGVRRPVEWSLVANTASFATTAALQHFRLI